MKLVWEREHVMKVGYRQQFALARFDPRGPLVRLTLRAVPIAATVIHVSLEATIVTVFSMPSQLRSATTLDVAQSLALECPEPMCAAVLLTVPPHDLG
jgi:hypothetical protein